VRKKLISGTVAFFEKVASKSTILSELYSRPYRDVVRREIELARLTKRDRVLNVGCGSIPFTAIHVARMSGADVVAIDRDREAVKLARQCIRRMNLQDKIKIYLADAVEKIPEDFDAAVVALQAEPKEAIMTNLCSCASRKARLVFRLPTENFHNQYDNLQYPELCLDWIQQDMKTFSRSYLFDRSYLDYRGEYSAN